MNTPIVIEFDPEASMDEMVERARKEWARANIGPRETYNDFAKRIGVSYRTVLRWLGRLSTKDKIVKRAINGHQSKPFDISKLPLPLTWSHEEVEIYSGPLVYVVMKDGHPMYIGSSKNGALRILHKDAHDCSDVIANCSAILFYRCKTRREANELEAALIQEYKPLFNTFGA